jgi:hypothetical protein
MAKVSSIIKNEITVAQDQAICRICDHVCKNQRGLQVHLRVHNC